MRSFKLADTCRRDNASSHRRAFPSSSLPSSDERTEVELVARGTAWATTPRGLPHRRNPPGVTHTKSIAPFRAGDRKASGWGKGGQVRVDLGGARAIKKKNQQVQVSTKNTNTKDSITHTP